MGDEENNVTLVSMQISEINNIKSPKQLVCSYSVSEDSLKRIEEELMKLKNKVSSTIENEDLRKLKREVMEKLEIIQKKLPLGPKFLQGDCIDVKNTFMYILDECEKLHKINYLLQDVWDGSKESRRKPNKHLEDTEE